MSIAVLPLRSDKPAGQLVVPGANVARPMTRGGLPEIRAEEKKLKLQLCRASSHAKSARSMSSSTSQFHHW